MLDQAASDYISLVQKPSKHGELDITICSAVPFTVLMSRAGAEPYFFISGCTSPTTTVDRSDIDRGAISLDLYVCWTKQQVTLLRSFGNHLSTENLISLSILW